MTNSEFKEKAREHQIRFKEKVLEIPSKRSPKRTLRWQDKDGVAHQKETVVKSSLLYSDSKDSEGNYLIFYPGFRKEITDAVNLSEVASGQMTTNLLRSEHIPYNIFFPMQYDLEGAKVLFNHLLGSNRISSINRILIEHNPGNLKDGTAFDVYVEYQTSDNQLGGIGIEVKYTEQEYLIKRDSKEWSETHNENGLIHLADNYRIPSFECGWFKKEFISDAESRTKKHVVANKFRQIWRNHLLGAAMIFNGELSEFTSLTVYPDGNVHFKEVLPEYETMLTDAGKDTFKHLTYEKLFSLMEQSFNQSAIPNLNDWITYLRRRYIVE